LFLRGLFEPDPEKRLTFKMALEHDWLVERPADKLKPFEGIFSYFFPKEPIKETS
jgi:hypothetical protein